MSEEQLTFWSEEAPARVSPSRVDESHSMESQDSCSSTFALFVNSVQDPDGSSGRTFRDASQRRASKATRGVLSDSCSQSFATSGIAFAG